MNNSHSISIIILILSFVSFTIATKSPKEWDSFSIKTSIYSLSSVSTNKKQNEIKLMAKLDESYSNEQKRAKINYEIFAHETKESDYQKGTLYFDATNNAALLINKTKSTKNENICQSTKLNLISNKLYLINPGSEQEEIAGLHIIGPTRLLFMIFDRISKRDLSTLSNGKRIIIHNLECFYIEFNYLGYDFSVYYSVKTVENNDDDYPIPRIVMVTSNRKISYEFTKFELFDNDVNFNGAIRRGHALIDPMAFSLASGCSTALMVDNNSKSLELFNNKSTLTTKFSFKAIIESKNVDSNNDKTSNLMRNGQFVAYDSLLKSMRIDSITNSHVFGNSRQIYNFKTDRYYDIIEYDKTKTDLITNYILDLKSESDNNELDDNKKTIHNTQCISGHNQNYETKLTFKDILLGCKKFVYMGKGRVRGINSLIYESNNCDYPFWFYQKLAYTQGIDEGTGIYHTNPKSSINRENITTILYVGQMEPTNPLLLVEFIDDDDNNKRKEFNSISIYDFKWDLSESPNGNKISELFSLEDSCSNNLGKNKYSRIDILLERQKHLEIDYSEEDDKIISSLLNNQINRNLAILSAFQNDEKLTSNVIFDLKSKLIHHKNNNNIINNLDKIEDNQLILLELRIAEHLNTTARAIYDGQARFNTDFIHYKKVYNCFSPRKCFSLAAHRGISTVFGYNSRGKICYLNTVSNKFASLNSSSMLISDKNGPIEMYRVYHESDTSNYVWRSRRTKSIPDEDIYLGSDMKLPYEVNDKKSDYTYFKNLRFILKKFVLDESDQKAPVAIIKNNNNQTEILLTDKISGFGLIELSNINNNNDECKLVEPAVIKNLGPNAKVEEELSTMTFEQCHAVCMADFNCQSFSFCIKNYEPQCLISKYNFKTANVFEQFSKELNQKKLNSNIIKKQITIKLDNGQDVQLIKNPNCVLYNKNYMELFNYEHYFDVGYNERLLIPVLSRDECAINCVNKNLQAIKDYSYQEYETNQLLKNKQLDLDLLEKLHNIHREASSNWCAGFYYIDRRRLNSFDLEKELQKRIRKQDLVGDKLTTALGYCIINSNSKKENEELIKNNIEIAKFKDLKMLSFEKNSFKAEFFYEKKFGAKLKASMMTPTQEEAYEIVSSPFKKDSDLKNKETYSVLKKFVENGENTQYEMFVDTTSCASYCFSHSWHMWPACRSFEMIYELENGRRNIKCIMNTITFQQAISNNRTDLIEYGKEFYHYDPKPGFMLITSILSSENELIESQFLFFTKVTNGIKVYFIGSMIIILISLILGIFIGIKLGNKAIEFWGQGGRKNSLSTIALPMDP